MLSNRHADRQTHRPSAVTLAAHACQGLRYGFISMSLIHSGLDAVNIGLLLLWIDNYLDPADTGLLGQLCPSNNLCMPILSLGPTYTAGHHAGP